MLRAIVFSFLSFVLLAPLSAQEFDFDAAFDRFPKPVPASERPGMINLIESHRLVDQLQNYVEAHDLYESTRIASEKYLEGKRADHNAVVDQMEGLGDQVERFRKALQAVSAQELAAYDAKNATYKACRAEGRSCFLEESEVMRAERGLVEKINDKIDRKMDELFEEYVATTTALNDCYTGKTAGCGTLSGKARRAEKAYIDFQKANQFQAKRHNQAVKSHQDLGMDASRLREEYNEASRKVERNLAELLEAKRFAYREFVSAYNVVVGNTPLMTEAQADQLFVKTLAMLSDVEKMDDPDLRSMMAKIQINDLVRVASNGHFGARKKLASIYAGDFLLDRDSDEAMHWLALAAKSGGDSETMLTLAKAYQSGSLGKQSDEQAFLWFLEASQFDDENGRQAIEALTNFQETQHSEQIAAEPLAEETLQP